MNDGYPVIAVKKTEASSNTLRSAAVKKDVLQGCYYLHLTLFFQHLHANGINLPLEKQIDGGLAHS
jgi:hypothetical protein